MFLQAFLEAKMLIPVLKNTHLMEIIFLLRAFFEILSLYLFLFHRSLSTFALALLVKPQKKFRGILSSGGGVV